ncbi:MAG: UDP-N-acetylmuramoyl-L-alanyl-D-glutamate--2,6-diaminopimelate ligase [Actinobacteria bacterium]|nr:UDP-N-acetylmuramoyl-L-alanyl-D-glutamate--2,6-diaminopimelate ligase [Actinomycetota bacterium]
MRLSELIAELDRVPAGAAVGEAPHVRHATGDLTVEVRSVAFDSRAVEPGALFCCVRGAAADGHDFASSAVGAGAVALLVERELDVDVPQLTVASARLAMGHAAAAVYGWPANEVRVVGVTGTNGKTTVTQLLHTIFATVGLRSALLGTLTGVRTTPESPDLQRWLAARRGEGVTHVAMEVSSHALALHRVAGTRFAVAVFTNLSRDHLDFHGTMDEYFRAKRTLFEPSYADRAVVNLDSPYGRILRDAAAVPTVGYSLDDATGLEVHVDSSRFEWRGAPVELQLGGRFNVSNALAAAEVALVLGLEPPDIAAGLSQPLTVPGRFELVDEGQPFTVAVDYAHTSDGLEQLLRAAGEVVVPGGRVHVVFGCGGDRDASKRGPMGEVAARLADRVVLTADNSRGESTGAIIAAVKQGFDRVPDRRAAELLLEQDRRRAIALALEGAAAGDIVLLAGKGHETTQTIGDAVVPFDDRDVARSLLRRGAAAP